MQWTFLFFANSVLFGVGLAMDAFSVSMASGQITIDENGVARNCIGRVLMDDLLEKLTYVTDKAGVEATHAAHEAEVARDLEEYRRNRKPATAEEIDEMHEYCTRYMCKMYIVPDIF